MYQTISYREIFDFNVLHKHSANRHYEIRYPVGSKLDVGAFKLGVYVLLLTGFVC